VIIHLVDGTYELFRHHFALPSRQNGEGLEIAATRGVVTSMFNMLEEGATHIGIATDRTVESFRNELWDGYKTGEDLDPELGDQFPILDSVLEAAGFKVFSMIKHEADDGLASAAAVADADKRVKKVLICTPDKDLGQCVRGKRVVQFDRRKGQILDAKGVEEKFGVPPASIPDYLGLVGDTADGFPGLSGWGAKSAATVLAKYKHLEKIPHDHEKWNLNVRSAAKLAETLREQFDMALLFRKIATVDESAPTIKDVEELRWSGPRKDFAQWAEVIVAPKLVERAKSLAASR
jgi:5'-3' exonuclease